MSYISENAGITNGAKIRALKELECMNEAMCEMEREGTTKVEQIFLRNQNLFDASLSVI